MSAIDEIRKEVVEFLLEQHEREKEAGREFYFRVDVGNHNNLPDYIYGRKLIETQLPFLSVLLYGRWALSPIAYLIITEHNQLFLIGEFETDQINKLVEQVSNDLYSYYYNQDFTFWHRPNIVGSRYNFRYIMEVNNSKILIDKLNYFFEKIKPNINKIIEPIRQNTKYSYYFFNRQQFEEYLKTEPYYIPPQLIIKKDLALKSFRVQNFKGIKQLFIDDLPNSARWIILTGENGFGKTVILQAIAAGLYGNFDESGAELVPGSSFIGVEYYANQKIIETNSRIARYDAAPYKLINELTTYGPSRLTFSAGESNEEVDKQSSPVSHLFNNGLLWNIERFLKDAFSFNRPVFISFVSLLKEILPNLQEIDIKPNKNNIPEVRYYERDEKGKVIQEGTLFTDLSAGYKSIITMIGDIVYRFSTRQNITNFQDFEGIVIIDELELHLHAKYQKELPQILSNYFRKIQFIASTHSPIPLLGVPKDTVILHVTRSEEEGIGVERLDVDFSVLTPNAILSSPIFGFKDLIPESKSDSEMIHSEDTYQAIEETQKAREQVDSFLSPEKQQELLRLLKQE